MLYIVVCFPWKQRPFAKKKHISLQSRQLQALPGRKKNLYAKNRQWQPLAATARQMNWTSMAQEIDSEASVILERKTRYRRLQSITGDKTKKWKSLYGNQRITKDLWFAKIHFYIHSSSDWCLYMPHGSTWQNVVIQKWPLLRLITSYHALGCLFRHFLEEFHQLLRDFHGGARHRPQSCLCKEKYHRAGGYKVLQAKDAKASRKKVGFKGRYFFFKWLGKRLTSQMDLQFSLVRPCDVEKVGFLYGRLSHSACLCLGVSGFSWAILKNPSRLQAACHNYKGNHRSMTQKLLILGKNAENPLDIFDINHHTSVFFDILRRFDWWGYLPGILRFRARGCNCRTPRVCRDSRNEVCQILEVRVPRVPGAVWRLEHLHIMLQP